MSDTLPTTLNNPSINKVLLSIEEQGELLERLEIALKRLFLASSLYADKEGNKALSRNDFIVGFNRKITNSIYTLIEHAPEMVQEFLLFLVKEGILVVFTENDKGNNFRNGIVVSSSAPIDGKISNEKLNGIYVLGSDNLRKLIFRKTNLNTAQILPADENHMLPFSQRLDPEDGTVDETEIFDLVRMTKILTDSWNSGNTVTFYIEDITTPDSATIADEA